MCNLNGCLIRMHIGLHFGLSCCASCLCVLLFNLWSERSVCAWSIVWMFKILSISMVLFWFQAPPSPSDSLNLPSPGDHNSYSPQESFSSSSSCYNSPSRIDSSYHGFAPEHYHYQHCNPQHCYCLSHCWPGAQESFPAAEYAPYYGPTDYAYPTPVEDNYFKRELPIISEMCYNVLWWDRQHYNCFVLTVYIKCSVNTWLWNTDNVCLSAYFVF